MQDLVDAQTLPMRFAKQAGTGVLISESDIYNLANFVPPNT
jgi:hypothetical protein